MLTLGVPAKTSLHESAGLQPLSLLLRFEFCPAGRSLPSQSSQCPIFFHLKLSSPSLCQVSLGLCLENFLWDRPILSFLQYRFLFSCPIASTSRSPHIFFSQTLDHTLMGYGNARQDLPWELTIQASSMAAVARRRAQLPHHLDQCLDCCELLSISSFGKLFSAPWSSLRYDQPVPTSPRPPQALCFLFQDTCTAFSCSLILYYLLPQSPCLI